MFTRDIVVFDTETTGLDISKHEIIQLAGVLLDKDTLEEKDEFCSYIRPTNWQARLPEAMAVNGIDFEQIKDAPDLASVLQTFEQKFLPESVLLAAYNAWFDTGFLRQAYQRLGGQLPHEFHTYDIWTLAYQYWCTVPHVANPKKPIGFGLSDITQMLDIKPQGNFHDALTDARAEAEVLRRLIQLLLKT